MKASTNDSDLTIIALLFMLLLVYCSVCENPASKATAEASNPIATTVAEDATGNVPVFE